MDVKVLGLVEVLRNGNTREEAFDYIKTNKVSLANIKQAAKEYDLYISPKWGKAELIERIVEYSIGARLKYSALVK